MLVTDLVMEGFQINEAEDWIQNAIKHKGKLREDLGLAKDDKIYDVPISTIKDYAKASMDNKRRIVFLKTLLNSRPQTKSKEEKQFIKQLNAIDFKNL